MGDSLSHLDNLLKEPRTENPVKCNACAVARKIETDCFCRNLPISNDPVIRISRNFEKKVVQNHVKDLSRKI